MENETRSLSLVRGLILLAFLAIVLIVVVPAVWPSVQDTLNPREVVTVNCAIGSEKSGFLSNPEVQEILRRDHALTVDFTRMGSIEQADVDISQWDCLWPSNTTARDLIQERHPDAFNNGARDAIIFNSPIVLYSWRPVVDTLAEQGLISEAGSVYTLDTQAMFDLLTSDDPPQWSDLGISALFGSLNVITTDPTRSNSGHMFYGLMANMLANSEIATLTDVEAQMPAIRDYYTRQGYMEESSGILFERFVSQGMGANPIIANYESLIIEFSIANAESLARIQEEIRVIYPQPTVWSSHPLVAFTDTGRALLEALQDERLQNIAWEQHGFRSGFLSNDPSVFDLTGIPPEVTSVMPLPRADAMIAIVDNLQAR